MTGSVWSRFLTLLLAAVLVQLPSTAAACTACMGDANSKSAGAINAAIFLLLGFIFTVLGLLVAFGLSLMRRAAALPPPHTEFPHHDSDSGAHS